LALGSNNDIRRHIPSSCPSSQEQKTENREPPAGSAQRKNMVLLTGILRKIFLFLIIIYLSILNIFDLSQTENNFPENQISFHLC